MGPTLGKNRVRARLGKETNPERGLPGAAALEKAKGAKLSFSGVSVRGGTGGPTLFFSNRKFGAGFCPAAGNRRQDSCLPGKTGAMRGRAPGTSRGRARLGKETNPERELLGAGAGFFPAQENRSSALACTQKEPRACAAGQRNKPGARLARRSRAGKKQTGQTALWAADTLQAASRVTSLPVQTALRRDGACAICSPQVQEPCVGLHPETAAGVRDTGRKETRCASCSPQVCSPQVRVLLTAGGEARG